MLGIYDFRLKGVVRASGTETGVGRRVLRLGIAGLHHELIYHTVEQHPVVIFLLDEFQEVVAMGRSVAEKAYTDVADRCLDVDQCVPLLHDGGF